MSAILFNFVLLFLYLSASIIAFCFSAMDLFGFLMGVWPPIITLIWSIVDFKKSKNRADKIKFLKNMFLFNDFLNRATIDTIGLNMRRSRANMDQIDIQKQRIQLIDENMPIFEQFIQVFGLRRKRERLLSMFKTQAQSFEKKLIECKMQLKLTYSEAFYFEYQKNNT